MKKLIYSTLAWLIYLLLANAAQAQALKELSKNITKNYSVSGNDLLKITNKFGKIQVIPSTSNGTQVKVDIAIKVGAKDEAKAKDLLEGVVIKESQNKDVISLETTINENRSIWNWSFSPNKQEFTINYTIEMPANMRLSLVNEFGNTYLGNFTGELTLKQQHGNLVAENLSGTTNKQIDVQFGNVTIASLEVGKIKIAHGNVKVGKSGNVVLINTFGDSNINEAKQLKIANEHSNLTIERLINIEGKNSFGDVKIKNTEGAIKLDMQHGDIKIENITKAFKNIDITTAFGDCNLKFIPDASFNFIVNTEFGDLRTETGKANFSKKEEEINSNYFEGKFGAGGNLVKINAQHGDVTFK